MERRPSSDFIPLVAPSVAGYYTSGYPTYSSSGMAGLNYLTELSGMIGLGASLTTVDSGALRSPPGLVREGYTAKEEEEEANSDLEVVDVVRAKRPREREVTVVELSDTTDEDSDAVNARANSGATIDAELLRQAAGFLPQGLQLFQQDSEPILILSSDEEQQVV